MEPELAEPSSPDANDEEFLRVLEAEHALLARIAYSIMRNEDDANDVLADAVAKTYARWRRGRIDDLAHYLSRAVRNTAIGRTRRRRSQIRALQLLAAQTAANHDDIADSSTPLVPPQRLHSCLSGLSEDCQTIIRLRILEEIPVKEVAARLFISQGTVKSRCSRCLKKLGQGLRE